MERRGNTFKHFKDIYLKSKSIAVLHVPYLLDSGVRSHFFDALVEVEHAFSSSCSSLLSSLELSETKVYEP